MRYDFQSPETAILRALYAFPYLTAFQITRLLYSPGSRKSRVNPLLKKLFDAEDVHRVPMFAQLQSGSSPYVYYLSTKGRNILKKQGYDFTTWRFPYEMDAFIKSSHFPHYMMATDFLIEASMIEGVEVKELMHDFTLKRIRKGSIIPDGWLHLVAGSDYYFCIEIDMDSEKHQAFLDKIGCIVWFVETEEYKTLYGAHIPTWVFWTPKGDARRDEMLEWMEEKLANIHRPEKVSWFRVGSMELSSDMFYRGEWYMPHCRGKRQIASLL